MRQNGTERETDWAEPTRTEAISHRKSWLSFSPEDEALVKAVDDLLEENIDLVIEDMYAHFLDFPETRKFFPDEATLRRAQHAQKNYFLRMTKGNYDSAYVADRLKVGYTHYRIGLEPTWYLGAYNRVITWLRKFVHQRYKDDQKKFLDTIVALTRLIFFDMGLAIEAYSIAKEGAIREHRDALAELEAERRVAQNLMEGSPSAIVWVNQEYEVLGCNPEFAELCGARSRDEAVGQNLFVLSPGLPTALFDDVLQSGNALHRSGQALQLSVGLEATNQFFDLAVWPIRTEANAINGLLAIFTDVTDTVLLAQQREDFVATLTHDLKTPILATNRAIKLMLEGDFGPVQETQKQILETIHQSNESMYNMVQTLLDVYRYDSGAKQLEFKPEQLGLMIESMVKELEPLALSQGIEMRTELADGTSSVNIDGTEIRRVIQNLLDNALKFTSSGGSISVSLTEDDEMITVAVRDTGKGISPEDKPKLFQRFWAPSSSGRYYASTGLGLYLCRKIVESHDGKIWCESQVGKGSIFYFTISKDL